MEKDYFQEAPKVIQLIGNSAIYMKQKVVSN